MASPLPARFYFFKDDLGYIEYFIVDGSGSVTTTTDITNAYLKNAPAEWSKVEQTYKRSASLYGIFSTTTGTYTLNNEAAKIVNFHTFTKGYDAKLKFRVDICVSTPTGYIYETRSISNVNFKDPETDHTGTKMSLIETGIAEDFKSNLDTEYEVPIGGPGYVMTDHDGTTIKSKYEYRFGESSVVNAGVRSNLDEVFNLLITPIQSEGWKPVATEHTAESIRMGQLGAGGFYGVTDDFSDQYERYILSVQQGVNDVLLRVKADFRWKTVAAGGGSPVTNAQFFMYTMVSKDRGLFTPQTIYTGTLVPSPAFGVYQSESVDTVFSIGDITPGDRIYVVVGVNADYALADFSGIQIETVNPENSRISLDMNFDPSPTLVEGMRWEALFKNFVEKFADGKYGLTPYLSGYLGDPSTFIRGSRPYRTIVTNGFSLKGITGSIYKASMGKFTQDAINTWGSGFGVKNGQVFAADQRTFYDRYTEIAKIELTNWKIKPLSPMKSRVIIGNEFDQTDTLNGTTDSNTKTTWQAPAVQDEDSALEYVSQINSSIYSQEKLRVLEAKKEITGSRVNDELYKHSIEDVPVSGAYKVRYPGPEYYVMGGIEFPTRVYNAEFTPMNNALRIKPRINSNTYPSTTPLKYASSERYAGMTSLFYDVPNSIYYPDTVENAPIVPDDDILFMPFMITGDSEKPLNIRQLIDTNPYGYISYTAEKDGKIISGRGFIDSVTIHEIDRDNFSWELILTPDNNLADYI